MGSPLGVSLPGWTLANLAVSMYMTGVIWFVQLVHYPLLAKVGAEQFVAYERQHTRRTGWVVAAPMMFEFAAAGVLEYAALGTALSLKASIALGLVCVIWISTFALQVPCHNRLERQFDEGTCHRLVATNWIRTLAWTARSLVLATMLLSLIGGGVR